MSETAREVELRILHAITGVVGTVDAAYVVIAGGLRGRYPLTEGYVVVRRYERDPETRLLTERFNDRGSAFPLWEEGQATDIDEGDLVVHVEEIANAPFDPRSCDETSWLPGRS